MQTYVCLMKLTAQGVADIKDAPERIENAIKFAKALGGEVDDVYITMGDYDYVAIGKFPDDEAALAFLLGLGAGGNVSTKTLKAFSPEEMMGALAKLP